MVHLSQANAAAIFGDQVGLQWHTAAAMPLVPVLPGLYSTAVIRLLRGLALAGQARDADADTRGGLLAELDDLTRWLAARAADAPGNFLHLLRLLQAERAWAAGDFRAAALARRRIERDLHDGAQQRLVSLALQLRAAQAAMPPELGAQLDRAVAEATGALDELREIAHGIHPAILAERGLAPTLKTLTRRSPIPADLQVQVNERLPEPVEVSAYYVIAEALANAAKHARASTVSVHIEVVGDVLLLEVGDNGVGGADFTRGTGLAGLKDRVEALGGRTFLDSPPGAGTSLRVELPLAASNGGVMTS